MITHNAIKCTHFLLKPLPFWREWLQRRAQWHEELHSTVCRSMAKYSCYHNACLCQAKQPFYDVTIDFMNLLFPGTAIFHLVCLACYRANHTHSPHPLVRARDSEAKGHTWQVSPAMFRLRILPSEKVKALASGYTVPQRWLGRRVLQTFTRRVLETGSQDLTVPSERRRVTVAVGLYVAPWHHLLVLFRISAIFRHLLPAVLWLYAVLKCTQSSIVHCNKGSVSGFE